MLTPASPGYLDRELLRLACCTIRRLRARGPLPVPLLVAAGLARVVEGANYLESTPVTWVQQPGVADTPPVRPDAWRRSTYWSQDPDPPAQTPWFRIRS